MIILNEVTMGECKTRTCARRIDTGFPLYVVNFSVHVNIGILKTQTCLTCQT